MSGSALRLWWSFPLLLLDCMALIVSAVLAFVLAEGIHALIGEGDYVTAWEVASVRAIPFSAAAFGAITWFMAHGHHRSNRPFWHEAKEVCVVGLFCLMTEGFLVFASKGDISRLFVVLTWTIAPFVIMGARRTAKAILRSKGHCVSRVVVFGDSEEVAVAAEALNADPHMGYRIVGMHPILSHGDAMAALRSAQADVAVLAMANDTAPATRLAASLSLDGMPLILVPPVSGIPVVGMQAQYVVGIDTVLLVDRSDPAGLYTKSAKRMFDVCISSALLVASAIPMVVVAALIAADGGSPLFAHERVGLSGRRFRCLKFRTMVRDADCVLSNHLENDPDAREEWRRDRKLRRDPRITGIGSYLRKTAIDEIPQLINVLRGDMSLVGPRPVTPEELERYGDAARQYIAVRPGITGLWQVSGRSDVSYERRVALDAWYVRNWSPWNDLAILARTIPAVLFGRGAY